MILHENRLPADDSHEISCLICYEKNRKICNCPLLQIIGGALRVKISTSLQMSVPFELNFITVNLVLVRTFK